jgi:hypothetical protein
VSAKQNVPSPRALFDLQLGKTDLIELAPGLVRRAGVLLQKQAEPAVALLPHWLSGYAFLFTVDTNLDRAKEMPAAWVANFAASAASLLPAQLPQASPPGAAGAHP